MDRSRKNKKSDRHGLNLSEPMNLTGLVFISLKKGVQPMYKPLPTLG